MLKQGVRKRERLIFPLFITKRISYDNNGPFLTRNHFDLYDFNLCDVSSLEIAAMMKYEANEGGRMELQIHKMLQYCFIQFTAS